MSLATILLIVIPIAVMVLMHGVGHGGHARSGVTRGDDSRMVGGTGALDGDRAERHEQGHQHGRRGGCC